MQSWRYFLKLVFESVGPAWMWTWACVILATPLVGHAPAASASERPGSGPAPEQSVNLPDTSSWLDKKWAVTFYAGRLTTGSIDDLLPPFQNLDFVDEQWFGIAASRQVFRGESTSIEIEAGAGNYVEHGGSDKFKPQVWGAAYLRYHNFPWNHVLRTTIAASVGVNYTFERSRLEELRSDNGETRKLQHYFAPEITLAHPDWQDLEVVARIHHRSPVYGLLGCHGCSSNTAAFGLRKRF